MSFDPAGRRRERQEKAQMRAKKQKKLLIRLGIAAVVLVLCGILLIILTGRDRGQQAPPAQETEPVTNTAPSASKKGTTTVKLTFGGDLTVTDTVVAAGGTDNNFTNAFIDVAPLLSGSDLAALNFEGVAYGRPYGSASGSAPQELLGALDRAGVDLLQVANSYSLNKGLSGMASTLSSVRAAGMEPLGAYADRTELQKGDGYVVCNVNGIRIAFVAFTKGMDGLALPKGSEGCVNVLYEDYDSTYQTVDTEGIRNILAKAEKAEADLTVAMLHWGSEFNDTISKSQETIVQLMKEGGVDAIIGTHSHYVQKIDYDRDAGTLVAYCLGDFFGDAGQAGSEYSILLDLQITKDNKSGETRIDGFDYTPIFTVHEEGKQSRVVRIREAMKAYEGGHTEAVSEQTYNAMKYALGRIEARISG